MLPENRNQIIRDKMQNEGLGEPVINAFIHSVEKVQQGITGEIPESSISSELVVPDLTSFESDEFIAQAPIESLAVIKLNGGLGTGMGLAKAKSLLPVKGEDCFLDFIARQILFLRQEIKSSNPRFLLMNSFSTQDDSLNYLEKYPELANKGRLDFLQNKVPKISTDELTPVNYSENPDLEWCPPGHGDIYPSLAASGLIDELLDQGIHYLFVSNSDNLGATVDLNILGYFAQSGLSFLMEVAKRTEADKKGGHLARRLSENRLVLRESAQCPEKDTVHFQDTNKYRYFNTNSLWINLRDLKTQLDDSGGFLELPLIRNKKTVNPADGSSEQVFQLESAMGAAIECFDKSGAILVPRSRFAPVKTTNDLLTLKSDAYLVTEDSRIILDPERDGVPPVVKLDDAHYKKMDSFNTLVGEEVPSLLKCEKLSVEGPVKLNSQAQFQGNVTIKNSSPSGDLVELKPGLYANSTFTL